jgi:IclR family transcriptional regulator, acetate operon repressor
VIETVPKGTARPASGTEAVTRAADVLLLFTGGPASLGVSEAARRLDLSKTVVHRILRSLASRQLVVFDEASRSYRLGPAAAALGARALRDLNLRQVALPILLRLQQETGETATVSALVGLSRVYVDQIVSRQEIKMTVDLGHPHPLHAGASSKAILAFGPPELRRHILSQPLAALTPRTPVSRVALEADLARVARAGVAVSMGERQPGAASVAAPVCGVDGYAIGSISVCGPIDRFDAPTIDRLVPRVREAGHEISRQLGWDGTYRAVPEVDEAEVPR